MCAPDVTQDAVEGLCSDALSHHEVGDEFLFVVGQWDRPSDPFTITRDGDDTALMRDTRSGGFFARPNQHVFVHTPQGSTYTIHTDDQPVLCTHLTLDEGSAVSP